MALNPEAVEEDSFIILGTSPGSSLDIKCNGVVTDGPLDKAQIEDAMKDLSTEASMAFKAHFKLGDGPSPASLMVASTIVSEDKSTEELQKRFGEILDENVLLKETLKQNNDSMKDQFLLIASCQEDMMKTHSLHKEKFDETRELVERLRQENKKLKQDILQLSENKATSGINGETGEATKSGPPSAVEFVTCPDDDTINKLTAQLELVEKQRRQVIVDNEKLTWQKESLEHIVDATSKERDDLREKLNKVELELCEKDSNFAAEMKMLKTTIQDLQGRLQSSSSITSLSTEEIRKRDAVIQQLEGKLQALQCDYKASQLKVLELENVKLEFTKHKSGTSEVVKIYKDQIQDLHNRLKDAQITLFQPVRLSLSPDTESSSSEFSGYLANVKLYDRTLKHLAELLNALAHGTSDNLVQTLGVVASLHDFKLERATAEQVRSGLADVKQQLEKQYSAALNNIGQVRSTLTIFEGIFKDYNELVKKTVNMQSKPANGANVEALTTALLARGQEVSALTLELSKLKDQSEEVDVLKAQLELYKSDFEAERTAREMMAVEKEHILTDLRTCQRRNQELTQHLQQENEEERDFRLSADRERHALSISSETFTQRNERLASQRTRTSAARSQENEEERDLRLSADRNRHALSRSSETFTQRNERLASQQTRTSAARSQSGPRPANSATPPQAAGARAAPAPRSALTRSPPAPAAPASPPKQTGNMVYKCPKCLRFSSEQYKAMEDHFDFCLDDF